MEPGETGIDFRNTLFESDEMNVLHYVYFYNGGGVATGDINNDGMQDILFTGNMVKNRLYINKGNFEFENITDESGIAKQEGWCTGATMTDVNGMAIQTYTFVALQTLPPPAEKIFFFSITETSPLLKRQQNLA